MLPFGLLVLLRLVLAAFFLLTSAYGVLNCSPFAFEMFIKPQLFPWLASFVAWHHVWNLGAYAISVVTLLPALTARGPLGGREKAARWLAISYVVIFGAAAMLLIADPYLPTLWNDSRALPTAAAALSPLMLLAAVDHLRAAPQGTPALAPILGPRRLLLACALAAGFLWGIHFLRAVVQAGSVAPAGPWLLTGLRTLSLVAALFAVIYAASAFITSIAARRRNTRMWEFGLGAAMIALAICEFLRRAVLPTISVGQGPAALVSAMFAAAIVLTWSGLALRRPAAASATSWTGTELLIAPALGTAATAVAVLLLPLASFASLSSMEGLDWSFGARRTILICEVLAAFGLFLRATRNTAAGAWSWRYVCVPPVATLAVFLALPPVTAAAAARTGNRELEPAIAFYRHAGAEALFKVLAETLVARPVLDPDYQRFLLEHADFSGKTRIVVPEVDFVPGATPAGHAHRARPDIFVFVIDSLRRDYLSPFNPQVTFTPNIEKFAAESFAFQNAFTRHGGTELAMPSIWAGAPAVRKVRSHGFDRMNAIEKLVNLDGYRTAINDFTVAEHLRPSTPRTTIDEGVPSVDTDLCSNVRGLQQYLDGSTADTRPVFGYFAPMNVHILNTRRRNQSGDDGAYPGFYAPYASRLKRIDACFGEFVSYLKQRQRYEESIIVLTSDHGDSLGEDGYWGHAMWLFPEDVRLPLIVHVPESLKARVTTDLTRLTFSTDIAPTLYALLGHPPAKPGPLFGEPLFVAPDCELSDRRRQAYLLTSSYGATYGLLRRNGRLLYVSDLVEWSESAYSLSAHGGAERVLADADLRRLNQRLIRERVTEVASFYQVAR